jgi:hypothetical protein
MNAARLILKQPTGWFAAGREVGQAMTLLSDGAFKLYLHLCLQADRHTARVQLNTAEWMQVLGKDPAWGEACLGELYRNRDANALAAPSKSATGSGRIRSSPAVLPQLRKRSS